MAGEADLGHHATFVSWKRDRIVVGDMLACLVRTLWDDYCDYCRRRMFPGHLGAEDFVRALRRVSGATVRKHRGQSPGAKPKNCADGIGLRPHAP